MSLDFARKLFGIIVWATSTLCFTNETCLCITFWAVQYFPTLHGVYEHWIWLFVQKGNLQISSSWVRFAKIKKKKLKWLFHSGTQSSCLLVQHPRKNNELHRDSITMNSSEGMPSGDNEMISTWRYVNRCFTKKITESSGWVSTVQHFKDLSSTKYNILYNTSLLVLQMHTWHMQLCSQRSLE